MIASEQAHFSVEKAARILGLELRTVPVDDEFRMLADFPLEDATAVVATVGTTSTTSVDPVAELADRCEEAGVWLHVDAAYAGSAAVCPELRWCLDGRRSRRLGRRQPAQVAVHAGRLLDALDAAARSRSARRSAPSAEYMAPSEGAIDIRDYGPALGRRFRALKLWAVLRCYGAEGLRALIREHVRLAALFEEWVRAEPGWEISAPRHFSTVCFRHESADNDEIARRATGSGRIFVATTKLRGRSVIRLAIGNGLHDGGGRPDRVGGAARVRAVIFDLWDTLVEWPAGEAAAAARADVGARRGRRGGVRPPLGRDVPPVPDGAARRRLSRARGSERPCRGRGRRAARVRTPGSAAEARRDRRPRDARGAAA